MKNHDNDNNRYYQNSENSDVEQELPVQDGGNDDVDDNDNDD